MDPATTTGCALTSPSHDEASGGDERADARAATIKPLVRRRASLTLSSLSVSAFAISEKPSTLRYRTPRPVMGWFSARRTERTPLTRVRDRIGPTQTRAAQLAPALAVRHARWQRTKRSGGDGNTSRLERTASSSRIAHHHS
jgi:hypothetical protein